MDLNLYQSGFVRRFHTHPTLGARGQTTGHHQWGVAAIILGLHPNPSRELLSAALTHDVGEFVTGDRPYPFKRLYPEAEAFVSGYEAAARDDMIGPAHVWINARLSDRDRIWLDMADKLECWLYVATVEPALLKARDWGDYLDFVLDLAMQLGVAVEVRALVREAME